MNYAYLDLPSKQEIRRKTLKALCLPGRQIPFSAPELPIAYGWGVGGMAITAALLEPNDTLKVVDHGSDDTVNALNIGDFFTKTANISITTT
ncbi:MAG: alpha-D-ribose 1-methylphosphonate 5-phosphate C-P-lyase PhnJ, partial [Shewanella sp.]